MYSVIYWHDCQINKPLEKGIFMQVQVVSTFDYDYVAKEQRKFVTKEGVQMDFAAQEARTAKCALVEVLDGSGSRLSVEIPKHSCPNSLGKSSPSR